MSYFTFKVNDGELDSTRTYRMTINVQSKLVGNLGETADSTAISLPGGTYNAYAQRFSTGSSAQEIEEVGLAITVPSGTTPKVSIWYGKDSPERKTLVLSNPSNIHTAAAVKTFKANSKTNGRHSLAPDSDRYWIVVQRTSGSGTIQLKRTTTGTEDALSANGWSLANSYMRKNGSTWTSSGVSGAHAIQAELRTVPSRQLMMRVVGMELSDPGPDKLYTHGEFLEIAVTFSEPVNIPDATITDPTGCGGPAVDHRGHGTNRIVFRCRIRGGPHTRVHVRENSLRPGGGGDGGRVSKSHPFVEKITDVHGLTGPGITDVRVNSPGSDGLWTVGERVEVRYTFDGPVTVATGSGTPVAWVRRVYASGDIYGEAVPIDRIDTNDANTLVFAKPLGGNAPATALELPANSLYPKHGVIAGTDTGAIAVFTHRAYRTAVGRPCGSIPDEIWCAELTVGRNNDNMVTGFSNGAFGSLSPRQFTYDGSEYSILSIVHGPPIDGCPPPFLPRRGIPSSTRPASFCVWGPVPTRFRRTLSPPS